MWYLTFFFLRFCDNVTSIKFCKEPFLSESIAFTMDCVLLEASEILIENFSPQEC